MVPFGRVAVVFGLVVSMAVAIPASEGSLRVYPAASSSGDAAWVLTTHRFNTAFTAAAYVGNGYFGERVPAAGMGLYSGDQGMNTWPLFNPRITTGVVSGLYGKTSSMIGGYKQAIATIPVWTTLGFTTPSGTYGPDTATASTVADYTQSLDLRTGTVTTSGVWTDPGGRRTRFSYQVFTNRAGKHLGVVHLTLTPLWSGTASVTGTLDGAGAQRLTARGATVDTATHTSQVTMVSTGVGTALAEAQVLRTEVPLTGVTGDAQPDKATASERMSFTATAGRSYEFTKYAAIIAGPGDAVTKARAAAVVGRSNLARSNAAAWQAVYRSDILVPGRADLQRVVHANEYALYASLRADAPSAVGPSGLGGEGYAGLVFWDAETWMFPTLLVQHPDIAKVIPDYRSRTLAAARRNATAQGHAGAFYPWTSGSDGVYDTNCYGASCERQLHLQGDIALSFWQYYLATRDKTWLRAKGWPMLKALARFWEVKAAKTTGGYEIAGVQPPDENHDNVTNSSYTNAVAALTLRNAASAARKLGITPPAHWATVARGLTATMPYDRAKGIYKEFDGYAGETIKQADVAMLTYPLDFAMSRRTAVNNLEYYAARTSALGPAMSDAIHAIDSSWLDVAGCSSYTYLLRSYQPFVRRPYLEFSEVRAPDIQSSYSFLTGSGGFLQTFLYGFTGFRGGDGSISIDPSLPPQLPRVTVRRMAWEGRTFTVDIGPKRTTLTLLFGSPLLVKHPNGSRTLAKGKKLTVETRRPSARATTDLARCRPAGAVSAAPGEAAVAAVDGSSATAWTPASVASGQWLKVDLGDVKRVRRVTVRESSAYGYRIQVSTNGMSWSTVATRAGAAGRAVTTFKTVKARYIRLLFAAPSALDVLTGTRPIINDLQVRS
ncbi:discoidin domain-containing protein [Actinocorallia sp. B10E7]|uniref:galactose-binding domain-containing protein n=1 Tax=Actinocorallia sp. B10E7 TaxID=3153558 RepID=UPI00325F0C1D